ncbi:HNH endonuclease [Desulfobaculum sp. SPO524]|uniref:HNH endonuclease n=1 Tax=Desulfobaculum sp. SPO524 TaxID=3378071 RepID=UPI003853783B
MTYEQYIQQIEENSKKLSAVKKTIIKSLWGSDDAFPKSWVASSELLELTSQKYFDRRIRELRDENGCDIESQPVNGQHSYRLKSSILKNAHIRTYLGEKEKKFLFQKHEYTCAICGKWIEAGVRGLQADHKIPLIRGGKHSLGNWQPLCNVCNVGKRKACAECTDDCEQCPWAFPEKFGVITMLPIPDAINRKLQSKFDNKKDIIRFLQNILKKECDE